MHMNRRTTIMLLGRRRRNTRGQQLRSMEIYATDDDDSDSEEIDLKAEFGIGMEKSAEEGLERLKQGAQLLVDMRRPRQKDSDDDDGSGDVDYANAGDEGDSETESLISNFNIPNARDPLLHLEGNDAPLDEDSEAPTRKLNKNRSHHDAGNTFFRQQKEEKNANEEVEAQKELSSARRGERRARKEQRTEEKVRETGNEKKKKRKEKSELHREKRKTQSKRQKRAVVVAPQDIELEMNVYHK
jgi:hypothetical protein